MTSPTSGPAVKRNVAATVRGLLDEEVPAVEERIVAIRAELESLERHRDQLASLARIVGWSRREAGPEASNE